ncbi:hypothetical protein A3712_01115 [Vibrio sp. HI00D65]|nr:hypothetical protein A3712_01115 [Vibrio sp. HI00D65]
MAATTISESCFIWCINIQSSPLLRYTNATCRFFHNLRVEILECNDDEALSAIKEGRVGFAIILDSEDLGFILIKGGSEPLIKEWFSCLYSK